MSDVPAGKFAAIWKMALVVVAAWSACGVYRWQHQALSEARAILRVPAATDLGSLCQRPDIRTDALVKLEEDGDIDIFLDSPTGQPEITGKLSARKIRNAPKGAPQKQSTATDGETVAENSSHVSTETWELIWTTPNADRAVSELAAQVAVIEERLVPANPVGDETSRDRMAESIARLSTERSQIEEELAELSPPSQTGAQDVDEASARERIQTLQKSLASARSAMTQARTDWQAVLQEFQKSGRLDVAAARLSPGLVQDTVLQLDQTRKLSVQLQLMNETERRLSDVYGDKHPQLLAVRQKFEATLDEIGGWDNILNESLVAERLKAELDENLDQHRIQEAELALQLELEESELGTNAEDSERISALKARLQEVAGELKLAQAEETASATVPGVFARLQPPELREPHWLQHFGVLLGLATICGLAAGWLIHRVTSRGDVGPLPTGNPTPALPSFAPSPESQLDLSQRRALRQSRLQRAYA